MANTTPESLDLERFMRRVSDEGGRYVVMEVSSHALDLGRVSEIDFSAAVFTNLSQDHLDFHRNLDDYRGNQAQAVPQPSGGLRSVCGDKC